MAKMRIYEIARSMQQQNKKIKSSDLVAFLNANGFEAKSAQSSIEGEAIPFLMKSFMSGAIPFEGNTPKTAEAPEEIKKELYECAQMVSALDARMLQLNEEIREAKKLEEGK